MQFALFANAFSMRNSSEINEIKGHINVKWVKSSVIFQPNGFYSAFNKKNLAQGVKVTLLHLQNVATSL